VGLPSWYRVLIYPRTKRDAMTVALAEVQGYAWRCKTHTKPTCSGCANFEKVNILKTVHGASLDPEATADEVLLAALIELTGAVRSVDCEGRRILILD